VTYCFFCFVSFFFLFIITKSLKRRLERRVAFASLRFFPVLLLYVPYAKFGVKLVTYCFFCFDSFFIFIIITKSPKRRWKRIALFASFPSFFLLLRSLPNASILSLGNLPNEDWRDVMLLLCFFFLVHVLLCNPYTKFGVQLVIYCSFPPFLLLLLRNLPSEDWRHIAFASFRLLNIIICLPYKAWSIIVVIPSRFRD
jgi:hypothetical protein